MVRNFTGNLRAARKKRTGDDSELIVCLPPSSKIRRDPPDQRTLPCSTWLQHENRPARPIKNYIFTECRHKATNAVAFCLGSDSFGSLLPPPPDFILIKAGNALVTSHWFRVSISNDDHVLSGGLHVRLSL
ncbi:hypothetical protein EVAR_13931_1 [Eumeta japonica]|uniref:Uncharacterized protein n=1 Tax=Eumeta variegata TaxID=151549 RepID=A0A4C1U8H5_EUMVA|nr:hypothetical protein EVAR_13931_1 [Eumeta japonica]